MVAETEKHRETAMATRKDTVTPDKKVFIKTYGCQMNVYDSERMLDVLEHDGYKTTDSPDDADLIVLNTCHIREKATEKVYSELGKLKKLKDNSDKHPKIAVAGCVAQAEGQEIIRRQPAVDLVMGPQTYHNLPSMLNNTSTKDPKKQIMQALSTEAKFEALPLNRVTRNPSAFLSVQEGCDKFCSFCVVPYTRGAEVSRDVGKITEEARSLAKNGVRDITILGQNVNAWHGSAPDPNKADWGLGDLCRHLAKIDGISRIRYSTSHPRDMNDNLIACHGDTPEMMPFLHLPIQSGSDTILHAMNRKHSAAEYLETLKKVRAQRPDIAIASDFIVGFPGETERDFQDTMDLVEEVGYAIAYSFKYSPRPGTPASEITQQVDEAVKLVRLHKLQAALKHQQTQFNARKIGSTLQVLVTGRGRKPGQMHGRTPYMQAVHFDGSDALQGKIVGVEITESSLNSLSGILVN